MEHYAGIDVSLEESSVCVVAATGKVVREVKVAREPERLVRYFDELELPVSRIGLDAGPLSQWLDAGLVATGRDAVLLETRHVKAALSAMTVKTDRKNAGIAPLVDPCWDSQRIGTNEVLRLAFEGQLKTVNYISTTFIFAGQARTCCLKTTATPAWNTLIGLQPVEVGCRAACARGEQARFARTCLSTRPDYTVDRRRRLERRYHPPTYRVYDQPRHLGQGGQSDQFPARGFDCG
jgi:hypothetical protein